MMFHSSTLQESKIHVEKLELATLYNYMLKGLLQIPRFQRDFVWPISKTQALLDSMYKEFPIGTFFFWQAPLDITSLFRELKELNIPQPPKGLQSSFILDGQQRLTSLFVTLSGLKLGSRDYGRICIDLKQAAAFEVNDEEDFNERIFVTHTPDNGRYIAVRDLIGPNSTKISKSIPDELHDVFIEAGKRFSIYPFSVVWVRAQPLSEAVEIFQRINQGGKRLSRYDLVAANVWSPDFDFRRRINSFNNNLEKQGFGGIDPTIITQSFALILKDKCTTATELDLKTEEIQNIWDKVTGAILLAIDFANSNLGVKRASYLPYRGILAVLAYYFYYCPKGTVTAEHRKVLWQWFWQVAISERYGSTSPTRMAEDAQKLRRLINGETEKFEFRAHATAENVLRIRMTSTSSALRNSILCLLALHYPMNFKDGSPINLTQAFFTNLTKAERHHIFPVGYLTKKGLISRDVHRVSNFCFIPANLNKEISETPPAEYLQSFKDTNPFFQDAADSHLLPVDPESPLWNNDFESFIRLRSEIIAERLNHVLHSYPLDKTREIKKSDEEQDEKTVELVETQIRDIIHQRLTAIAGDAYWDDAVPRKIRDKVNSRIQSKLDMHPYLSWADYSSDTKCLEECDVSDYIKIVQNNWSEFDEIFRDQAIFRQHMDNFRIFRNNIAHHKPCNNVEDKLAEAAIMWIQQSLDKYASDIDGANIES